MIDKVQDEHVFGLFPEFRDRLSESIIDSSASRLREMDAETAEAIIETVPKAWDVSEEARRAWAELIYRRAAFVADNIQTWIELELPWFGSAGE